MYAPLGEDWRGEAAAHTVAQAPVCLDPQHADPHLSRDEQEQGRGCDDALDSNDHGLEVFRGPV